jgi:urease accessory protein
MNWLSQMLQTSDSLFPSGSFAHSFGLEGLVQLGRLADPAALAGELRAQIVPALERFELPFVRLAFEAARAGQVPRLLALDERYGAMKGSFELRQASSRIGSQRLQMLQALHPHPLLARLQAEQAGNGGGSNGGEFKAHAAVMHGVQAALSGAQLEAALLGFYYQTLAGVLSAALKLIRIGQTAVQSLLAEHLGRAAAVIARSRAVAETEIGWFQPVLDIASMRHETAYTRVFIS